MVAGRYAGSVEKMGATATKFSPIIDGNLQLRRE